MARAKPVTGNFFPIMAAQGKFFGDAQRRTIADNLFIHHRHKDAIGEIVNLPAQFFVSIWRKTLICAFGKRGDLRNVRYLGFTHYKTGFFCGGGDVSSP